MAHLNSFYTVCRKNENTASSPFKYGENTIIPMFANRTFAEQFIADAGMPDQYEPREIKSSEFFTWLNDSENASHASWLSLDPNEWPGFMIKLSEARMFLAVLNTLGVIQKT